MSGTIRAVARRLGTGVMSLYSYGPADLDPAGSDPASTDPAAQFDRILDGLIGAEPGER